MPHSLGSSLVPTSSGVGSRTHAAIALFLAAGSMLVVLKENAGQRPHQGKQIKSIWGEYVVLAVLQEGVLQQRGQLGFR